MLLFIILNTCDAKNESVSWDFLIQRKTTEFFFASTFARYIMSPQIQRRVI